MSQRFTSGGAGRFSFDIVNQLLDSVARLEGNTPQEDRPPRRNDRTIVAVLRSESDPILHHGILKKTWAWEAVRAVDSPSSWWFELDEWDEVHSDMFGPYPSGMAVQLSGEAHLGDVVVLTPLDTKGAVDTQRFFGFVGSSELGRSSLLQIESATVMVPDRRWKYEVSRRLFDDDGSIDYGTTMQGIAYNTYEYADQYNAWGHGQPLVFQGPNSRIVTAGPVQGFVVGTLVKAATLYDPNVFAFTAPVPLIPECTGPTPLMGPAERAIDMLLEDGIA